MKYESIREITNKKGTSFKVQINYGDRDHRKQYSKTFSVSDYPSKQACLNAAKNHRDMMKVQLGIVGHIDGEQTLGEVWELRHQSYPDAPETFRKLGITYRKYIVSKIPENTVFAKITYIDIAKTLNDMVDIASNDTIGRAMSIWRQLYETAIMNDIVRFKQTDKVRVPKSNYVPKRRDVSTSFDEIKEVCELMPNTEYANLVRFALMLMYYTGIRPAECFVLTGEDFDFDNMILRINKQLSYNKNRKAFSSTPKTDDSERFVPLDINILSYRKLVSNGLIFVHNGEMLSTDKVDAYLKKYKKGFTLYKMRHLFATDLLIKHKVDTMTVKELMGHKNIQTTISYSRTDEDTKRKAIEIRGNF